MRRVWSGTVRALRVWMDSYWAPLVAIWIAYALLITGVIDPAEPVVTDDKFYEVAALVLPTLLIAIAIEAQVFRLTPASSLFVRACVGTTLAFIVGGEVAAFQVVAGSDGSNVRALVTIVGLLCAAVLVVVPAIIPRPGTDD